MTTPKEVLAFAKKNNAVFVDLKFIDLPGVWQHFAVPIDELSEESFEDGFGFDGSSIRGWKSIHASDMIILPDPSTVIMDPFKKYPTISLICDIADPITKEPYDRDPRYIATKATNYMKSTGVADAAYFGPEAEFFIFDDVRYDQNAHEGYYFIDSIEGTWNTGSYEEPNLGYKPRHKEGYFPVPPTDSLDNLRADMVTVMQQAGIYIEAQHHEVATAGQGEIDMRFGPMIKTADDLMLFKYIVKNVAVANGRTATFMPKPLFGDNGSGMHTHQSLWKDGKPLFAGNEYAGISEMALFYIGGIIKHAKALAALTNPTTNSYKRLVPGFEAPVNLAYSARNRSASIRIPMYSPSPKAKRVEVRFPDPSCNPYMAFAAMLMAGLDGIENRIHPGEPMEKDLYELPPEEIAKIPQMPGALDEALNALESDYQFLLKGNVFTEDVIKAWIRYKRDNEVDALRLRPHPHEFYLYYDI
ncbi:MAG: type I glutamate--ammonia ligase [Candidatus Aquicultor secundus]|uniref:Glutamine synthetase n=1 Tax=Candidatus Aquicultor secundus TaxID=1973895 RepID=A0A2M7T867_9ACTN|nr:type I glutamate--ammonia ligase [Candidatus Aquicultor secundus]NCO66521.1 type I glutamate--ammonia ligase [Solirubrobacter sp.]OIO87062.1 MAG: type I glutamate--ammonia ligase [Candidatus Aquicultor secundus]PIU27552.1 MAG: type I glutamate--ammonia ligase [Candidatus Aquicultor secundus]PIW22087.1 MAG: type I glutamate--ammonia ligase [Candidatus Aquicultor secundus]PIX51290.1 MAG: type I glutamate--ammonia ligase [Candidatus Aquicultor secundus]